jgi:UDP-N-acetylmuramoyl-L-alanyl-D-glutamate--2,6-diaminopimelate ligase
MRLATLLDDHGLAGTDPVVTGLAIDHRKVAPGTIFGAFVGEKFNGEDFIAAAVEQGRRV